jgi:ABC-2 type transport system permease protein
MFRANFLVRLATHVIWLSLMLAFLKVIFLHTRRVGDWDEARLLAFVGTYLTLNAAVNCLFMNGCIRFSELVRTGNRDFELVKPVDEQFLLTCNRSIGDYSRRYFWAWLLPVTLASSPRRH